MNTWHWWNEEMVDTNTNGGGKWWNGEYMEGGDDARWGNGRKRQVECFVFKGSRPSHVEGGDGNCVLNCTKTGRKRWYGRPLFTLALSWKWRFRLAIKVTCGDKAVVATIIVFMLMSKKTVAMSTPMCRHLNFRRNQCRLTIGGIYQIPDDATFVRYHRPERRTKCDFRVRAVVAAFSEI